MEPRDEGTTDAGETDDAGAQPMIAVVPNGPIQANCYVVMCPTTHEAMVVDPGAEAVRILDAIHELGAHVTRIVHTHGHFDHIGATEALLTGLPERVPVAAHPADAYLYSPEARAMGATFGYPAPEQPVMPDEELRNGDALRVGNLRFEVIATPGHTPGSVSLRAGDLLLSGDTLFRRGIGRTDLPGGDEEAIYESILTRLYPLPAATRVLPGHGPQTTIGEERRSNPFVQAPQT
ncbi:MAG TPA: MBL fold metallo-hydrolase [Ktedonobacterales bacterium]|nr:MBL fold metallo-hydrolase [Ktedonobacterales bacterium]